MVARHSRYASRAEDDSAYRGLSLDLPILQVDQVHRTLLQIPCRFSVRAVDPSIWVLSFNLDQIERHVDPTSGTYRQYCGDLFFSGPP